MIIKKLILKGYKRLFLNNIEYLEYTPESSIQILLGDNGSGKSSILKELSPLPADLKKYYKDDGYKYIEITHRGSEYILSSGYTNKGKHSFIKDGQELNTSGIKKIQLELVHTHFKLDVQMFNIVLGLNQFTRMSPAERKKWLTQISNIDYKYPITVFNKLRTRYRDVTGGIKLLQSNILNYKDKILPDGKLKKITEDTEHLTWVIEHLISLYDHNSVNIESYDIITNRLRVLVEEGNRYSSKIFDLTLTPSQTEVVISNLETKKNILTSELNKTNKMLSEVNELTQIDIQKHKKELKNIDNKIMSILNNIPEDIKRYFDVNNISNLILTGKDFHSIVTDVIGYLEDIPSNINSDKKVFEKVSNEVNILNSKYNDLVRLIEKTELMLKNIISANTDENKVECKKCGNIFYKDYDEEKERLYKKRLENFLTSKKELEPKLENMKIELEKIIDKRNKISILFQILKSHNTLSNVWLYIFHNYNIHTDNIESIVNEVNKFTVITSEWIRLEELINKKEKLIKLIDNEEEKKVLIKKIDKDSKENLIEKVQTLTSELVNIDTELSKYKIYLNNINKVSNIYNEITNNLNKIRIHKDQYLRVIKNQELEKLVNMFKSELLELSNKIEDNRVTKIKLVDDTKQLEKYTSIAKVLKLAIKELSPTEGLIAKSINSFLNGFIGDINSIINTIWSYNIELLPCVIDENNDLDYKFRVKVNNDETIEDIGFLSSSMQEIVNLAFKIVFMRYNGFIDYPLILDEFGASFDVKHRSSAYNIIDKLLTSDFKQTFIVSHYEEAYLRFSHADINIVSSNNINIKDLEEYNKNFKIS